MKTMPLEEALKLKTPEILEPVYPFRTGDPKGFPVIKTIMGTWIAKTDCQINTDRWISRPQEADANAALLAHFYNHGPELVEALRACLGMLNNTHYADHHPQCPHPDSPCLCVDELAGFRSLLAKASTVQMP